MYLSKQALGKGRQGAYIDYAAYYPTWHYVVSGNQELSFFKPADQNLSILHQLEEEEVKNPLSQPSQFSYANKVEQTPVVPFLELTLALTVTRSC